MFNIFTVLLVITVFFFGYFLYSRRKNQFVDKEDKALSTGKEGKEFLLVYGTSINNKVVEIFGRGKCLGYKEFPKLGEKNCPTSFAGLLGVKFCASDLCFEIENGKLVWGCECYCIPMEKMEEIIAGREMKILDIDKTRKKESEETLFANAEKANKEAW